MLLSVALLSLNKLWGTMYRQAAFIDRTIQARKVLNGVLDVTRQLDFDSTIALCTAGSRGNGSLDISLPDNCLVTGTQEVTSSTAVLAGMAVPYLDVRLRKDGMPSSLGNMCVQITRCSVNALGTGVKVDFRIYVEDTPSTRPLIVKENSIRKSR